MILHFLLPFILLLVVFLHLIYLHIDQTSVYKNNKNGTANAVKLIPLSLHRDAAVSFIIFLIFYGIAVLNPELVSHPDNYIQEEPSITPKHIVPEWYFLPMYGLLRLLPDKVFGMLIMILAIL